MTLTPTIDVVWRSDRERWAVEGGHGPTAVLGIVSLHDAKVEAIREAHHVAREHGAEVVVVGAPEEPPSRSTDDR